MHRPLSLLLLAVPAASAAISYSTPGSIFTENFDSLANNNDATNPWANNSTLPGWFASYGGTDISSYLASNGVDAYTGNLLSLGSTGSTDRALGSQGPNSGSTQHRFAVEFVNTSTVALTQFTLTYTGEIWRAITGEGADGFTFEYRVGGGGEPWIAYSPLDWTSPYTAPGGSTSRNGNDAANRSTVTSTVTGIEWAPGQSLFFRWSDTNTGGVFRAQIGIDDVFMTAVPEPSTSLLGLGAAFVLLAKRRR